MAVFLYSLQHWELVGALLVLLIGITVAGYWLGLWMRVRRVAREHDQMVTLQSAALGLLALLMGFTFSMAMARYDDRRALVLEEANAIGTAALRAGLLPAEAAGRAHATLRAYVDTRLDFALTSDRPDQQKAALNATLAAHTALWNDAATVQKALPGDLGVALYLESLNAVIDIHEMRRIALMNHVPVTVLAILLLTAGVALGFTGFQGGVSGGRYPIPAMTMAALVAVVVALIIDLDRPRQGLVTVSQQAMEDLRDTFPALPPAAAETVQPREGSAR